MRKLYSLPSEPRKRGVAAVGVLLGLEPPKHLHDACLGVGIAVTRAAARSCADRAGGAGAGHRLHRHGRLDNCDRVHRRRLHGDLRRRRSRHWSHCRDRVGIWRVDGDLDFLHRRGLDIVWRNLLFLLELLGLFLDTGNVDLDLVLLLARYHRHDAEHDAEEYRNYDCDKRG